LDKLLLSLGYKGKAVYLPPRTLKDLKEPVAVLPIKAAKAKRRKVKADGGMALATSEKLRSNPIAGITVTPPGAGLMALFEKELGVDFAKVDLSFLERKLPKLLIEDLELLEDITFDYNSDGVYSVKMRGLVCSDLCREISRSSHIDDYIGCPVCSSMACILAKVTGREVIIESINHMGDDGSTVEAKFAIVS
jgi:hypothetical protein